MSGPWLLLDVSALAYKSFYAMGGRMSWDGDPTEVLFGVFREVAGLCDLHSTRKAAFFFDGGYDHRQEIYPGYKSGRRKKHSAMGEEELELRRGLRKQIYHLREKHLPRAGFKNVFFQEGCEADDLIASVCELLNKDESAIVVSPDQDLFQLLSRRVVMWNGKAVTEESFRKKWGIGPSQWADVKAIAGCHTDDLPGIDGVGEKTAIKFLAGTLKPGSKAFDAIVAGSEVVGRNYRMTKLPGPWTDPVELVEDSIDGEKWDFVVGSLGMKSLLGRMR